MGQEGGRYSQTTWLLLVVLLLLCGEKSGRYLLPVVMKGERCIVTDCGDMDEGGSACLCACSGGGGLPRMCTL